MEHNNPTEIKYFIPDMAVAYEIFKEGGIKGKISLQGLGFTEVADVYWTCTPPNGTSFYWLKFIAYVDEDPDESAGELESFYNFKSGDLFVIKQIPYYVIDDENVGLKILQLEFVQNEAEALHCLQMTHPEASIKEVELYKFIINDITRYAWGGLNTGKNAKDNTINIFNMIPYDNVLSKTTIFAGPVDLGDTIKQQGKTFLYDVINGKKTILKLR